jgi:hypothetical protein
MVAQPFKHRIGAFSTHRRLKPVPQSYLDTMVSLRYPSLVALSLGDRALRDKDWGLDLSVVESQPFF